MNHQGGDSKNRKSSGKSNHEKTPKPKTQVANILVPIFSMDRMIFII